MTRTLARHPFFIRLFHWEYWNFSAVYVPIYIVWIGLCIRARSFFFFAASNPAIKNGGFLNESKKDIAPLIPACHHPRTFFFSVQADPCEILRQLRTAGLELPLIGKPDLGSRGRGIKKLCTWDAVKDYAKNATIDFHIQEFITLPNEVGIFYYRLPGEARGHISGVVRKEFLSVIGDGKRTIGQLMQQNKRAILQYDILKRRIDMKEVLALGEVRELVPYGNHARGAKFLDEGYRIDGALTLVIDELCRQIPEFHFGRLDIRYRDWEELRQGRNFYVIEVNGAGSEPTHIYDPVHSIFFAWKEIIRHWVILWRISRLNHKRGFSYLSTREGIQMFKEDKAWSEKLAAMSE
ncbi:MAG: hypothetical protein BGO55_00260 [Sphingobacteriales bacterium 50-39]|nr:hypothetical protein [Sphingobacteriales bacterium]OJW53553.1 MAG: hypothetical protein BGO55_00260 [Sphingobacteriales bacterium 50-39]